MSKPMELMDVEEVAKYLKVTTKTIYRLLKADTIPAMKVGHLWRFDREVIDQWLRDSTKKNKEKGK